MSTQDTRTRIQEASVRLTEEIVAIFAQEFSSLVSGLAASGPRKPTHEAPGENPGQDLASTSRFRRPRESSAGQTRILRTGADMADAIMGMADLLRRKTGGLRIEQINAELGAAPKELAHPIQKLLAEGRIRKSGTRRATKYFPA